MPVFGDDLNAIDYRPGWAMGGTGGYSSTSDVGVLCQMMLNGGSYGNSRVLSPVTVKRMTERQTPWWDTPERLSRPDKYSFVSKGLGWMVRGNSHYRGSDIMSPRAFFQGGAWGMRAIVDPEYDLFTVFFTSFTNDVHHQIHHVFGTMAFAAVTEL